MKRFTRTLLGSVVAMGLAACPGAAYADVDDWDPGIYGSNYYDGYGYGYGEYGTNLMGYYNDDDVTDDWYYDDYGVNEPADNNVYYNYDYNDTYTGLYDDYANDFGDELDDLRGDGEAFGDDEWEYGAINAPYDPGAAYPGYGFHDSGYRYGVN